MVRILDERFLTVHPRTELWWEQREQCRRCAHHRMRPEKCGNHTHGGSGRGEYCLVSAGKYDKSCISAREESGRCGPDAKLFEENVEAPDA